MQRWTTDTDAANPRRCLNCGSHVSAEFRRTHGDEFDRAHACPECEDATHLSPRAAGRIEEHYGGDR